MGRRLGASELESRCTERLRSAWLCGFVAGYAAIARGVFWETVTQGSLRNSDASLSERSDRP